MASAHSRILWLAVALTACANLTETTGGVATLQILAPRQAALQVGDTTRLIARALDRNGDDVSATIEWRAPDSTLSVDGAGLVTADSIGTGRVQARIDALISDFITFSIILRPDTLVLVGDSILQVPTGQDTTPALTARLDSYHLGNTVPAGGSTIIYRVVEPVFGDPAQRTVELTGQVLVDTVLTGGSGLPAAPVQLWRIGGQPSPDSAIVEISATRFQGTETVAGSGQRFVVRFDP